MGGVKNFLACYTHDALGPSEIKGLACSPINFKKEIGRRVALARNERGWTLKELSTKIGGALDPNRISNYETGFRMPGPDEIVALAKALGRRPAYLMALEDAQIPITPLEESLIRNWRTLPERERMEHFRRIEAMAMTHRDPVSDQRVERSLGKPAKAKTPAKQ